MAPTYSASLIIETWSDPNLPTGDFHYRTHDGRQGTTQSAGYTTSGNNVRRPTPEEYARLRKEGKV